MELWPSAKLTLGPSIEDGFYYDIDFGTVKISEADFPAIEAKMHAIAPPGRIYLSGTYSDELKKTFAGNPYKLELITEIIAKKEPVSVYSNGDFSDLCRGGHADLSQRTAEVFQTFIRCRCLLAGE